MNDASDWVPVLNTTSETIPSFGVMQLTGDIDADGNVRVKKPDAAGTLRILFNGSTAIRPGKTGQGCASLRVVVAYDQADGTPAIGDEWGPGLNTWLAKKGSKGVFIFGAGGGVGNGIRIGASPGGDQVFMSLLTAAGTGSDAGRFKWVGQKLTDGGGYGSDLSNTSGDDFTAVPAPFCNIVYSPTGANEFYNVKPGQYAVMWRSKQDRTTPPQPQYEFYTVSLADDTHPGLIALEDQIMGNGDKTFKRRVLANLDRQADSLSSTKRALSVKATDMSPNPYLGDVPTEALPEYVYQVFAGTAPNGPGVTVILPFVAVGNYITTGGGTNSFYITPRHKLGVSINDNTNPAVGNPFCVSGYVISPELRVQHRNDYTNWRFGRMVFDEVCGGFTSEGAAIGIVDFLFTPNINAGYILGILAGITNDGVLHRGVDAPDTIELTLSGGGTITAMLMNGMLLATGGFACVGSGSGGSPPSPPGPPPPPPPPPPSASSYCDPVDNLCKPVVTGSEPTPHYSNSYCNSLCPSPPSPPITPCCDPEPVSDICGTFVNTTGDWATNGYEGVSMTFINEAGLGGPAWQSSFDLPCGARLNLLCQGGSYTVQGTGGLIVSSVTLVGVSCSPFAIALDITTTGAAGCVGSFRLQLVDGACP